MAAKAVERLFAPAKLNFETLGNALPHLHTHIVPRFVGDPTPGRPLLGAPGVTHRRTLMRISSPSNSANSGH